jgi:5-methylcytosine-specific restriction enzyme A
MWSCPKPCKTCGQAAVRGSKYCTAHQPNEQADQKRRHEKKSPWNKYYHTAHWHNLRTLVLARDPICVECKREASTDADHIVPHRGNWDLFCDLNNLQGLCAACHSRKTSKQDGGYGH